jgi:hypothetical protein
MPRYKNNWKPGDRARLAHLARIPQSYLCDIMAGRKECSAKRAEELEAAAAALGYRISAIEWAFPARRKSPLFPKQR